MTALRNFPNAPAARRATVAGPWRVPALLRHVWQAVQNYGQRRAAWELDVQAGRRALGNPLLARQLRSAAADCRRAATTTPTPANQAGRRS